MSRHTLSEPPSFVVSRVFYMENMKKVKRDIKEKLNICYRSGRICSSQLQILWIQGGVVYYPVTIPTPALADTSLGTDEAESSV